MAKRTKRSAIVPKIVRGTIAVGVIPAFTAAVGCGSSQVPVVAAMSGPPPTEPMRPVEPPVVAAMGQSPLPPGSGEGDDAGSPEPLPADAGADAQTGSTTDANKKAR